MILFRSCDSSVECLLGLRIGSPRPVAQGFVVHGGVCVCVFLMVYSGDLVIYVLPSNIYRINSVLSSLGNFRDFTLNRQIIGQILLESTF